MDRLGDGAMKARRSDRIANDDVESSSAAMQPMPIGAPQQGSSSSRTIPASFILALMIAIAVYLSPGASSKTTATTEQKKAATNPFARTSVGHPPIPPIPMHQMPLNDFTESDLTESKVDSELAHNVTGACDPGWDPESGVMPANATAQAEWAKDARAYAGSVEATGGHPWSGSWPRPLFAAGPMLKDGWEPFWNWYSRLPCKVHSPECHQVPRWAGCCHTHLMIKGKLIAFSDHMREIGWPHWWVHAGTMLGLVREQGLLIPHDHDADIQVVAKFNGNAVFWDFTKRLLLFNEGSRYAPFYFLVAAHHNGRRGPFCRYPWGKGKCRRAFHYHGSKEKFVATKGDFMIRGGHTGEFGHVDISLLKVKGAAYDNACQQTFTGNWMHPTWWTEQRGLPAACPFGLKVGNQTYHGVNCPDNVVPYLSTAYGHGAHGWENREVKFPSEARWYRSKRWRSSDVGKAAAEAAAKLDAAEGLTQEGDQTDSDSAAPDCFAIGGGGGAGRRLVKKGREHNAGCSCTKVGEEVQCRRRHRAPPEAPSATQQALNKLSRAEEAARGIIG